MVDNNFLPFKLLFSSNIWLQHEIVMSAREVMDALNQVPFIVYVVGHLYLTFMHACMCGCFKLNGCNILLLNHSWS